jgi:predicted GH43/DUF377 family glycosyl hydrolase
MTVPRSFTRCLLRPEDVPPSQDELSVVGVFNPAAVATAEGVVLLVRVAEVAAEKRSGWIALPRWDVAAGRVLIDWAPETDVIRDDARCVRFKSTGLVRLTFASHLCIMRSRDGLTIDGIEPARILPASEMEEFGIEDPRATRIGDVFYFTYVGVSRHGPATALASTRDFKSFQRHGIIFCPDNKDVVLFPEKIGDRYFAIHRPSTSTLLARPQMWIASSGDLLNWGGHTFLFGGTQNWEIGRVGAGAPPIRTKHGWLELYHGNDRRHGEIGVGRYSGGLLLLNADEPWQIRGASGAVLVPEADFERRGFVPEVVFPTGIVEQGDSVLVYYGAADTVTGVAEFRMRDLLAAVGR